MLITLLEVENFQGVRKIVIAPGDRNLIRISGKNYQGKTSLLAAIKAALCGVREAPDDPVRHGEDAADIKIDLGDGLYMVHRRFLKGGGTSLKVFDKDGELKKPQQVLDKILGTRFLNPLLLIGLKGKEQRETLLRCVKLDIDLDQHEAERKKVFDQRTDINRDCKRLAAELSSIPSPGTIEIPEEVHASKLLDQLTKLQEQVAERDRGRHTLETMRADVARRKETIGDLTEMLVKRTRRRDGLDDQHAREKQELETRQRAEREAIEKAVLDTETLRSNQQTDLVAFVKDGKVHRSHVEKLDAEDLGDQMIKLKTSIAAANDVNAQRIQLLARKEARDTVTRKLWDADKQSDGLTAKLKELAARKATALQTADMPIPDLDVTADAILYKGTPLTQASAAEQLHVSLAIAAALSPNLREILITEGYRLDSDGVELVRQFAKDNDLHVWLERVGEEDNSIVIEEGIVKS